jgi:soluble lytic murein transglycosylase-like protein
MYRTHRRAFDRFVLAGLMLTPACASHTAPALPPDAPAPLTIPVVDTTPARTRNLASHNLAPRKLAFRSLAPRTRLDSTALESAMTQRLAHRPLAEALARRSGNPEMADRAAEAVVHEAGRLRISPSVLAAVLLIENTPLDTDAVSKQGAVGLMQVMPVHAGSYGCTSEDLLNVEANICHGARILANMLHRTRSMPLALKRYNGCVRGRNTPRCYRYPIRVLRTASRLRREMLVASAKLSESGPDLGMAMFARTGTVRDVAVADDSVTTPVIAASNVCSTLFSCLRDRWSRTR